MFAAVPGEDLVLLIAQVNFFFKDLFIYSFRESEREAETQAEGEAGSMQEARRGTRSLVSRITPRAAGGAKPLRHQGYPNFF